MDAGILGSTTGVSILCLLLLGVIIIQVLCLKITNSRSLQKLFRDFVLSLLLLGIAAVIWFADFERRSRVAHREGFERGTCANNLKRIGMAMLNYHDAYGCLPPAHVVDEEGRPLYSWRVLILPFLEHRQLYEQFRLDEPWNSAHNLTLLDDIPQRDACYRCPADLDSPTTATSYVMILGPNTVSDGSSSRSFKQVLDGVSNTIAVVEVVNSGIQWTEPRDLLAYQISFCCNDPDRPGIASRHRGGAYVLMTDSSVTFVADNNSPAMIRALTTIDGGEDVSALNDF